MSHHHDTTEIDWDVMAPHLERSAELHRPAHQRAAAWIAEQLPVAGVRRILDIGSGPGVVTCLLAEAFPYAEVVAVDGSPALLDRARHRAGRTGLGDRVHTHCAELPGGMGELGEADLVWAGSSLHHIGDQRAALEGLAGLLRPGGLIALIEGGLTARHLPRDTGIGTPDLEARLDAVSAEWFNEMRAKLPGAEREVEDWRALLTAVGLAPSGTRSFLLDIPAPLPHAVREQLVAHFTRQREVFADRLTADDAAAIDLLLTPEDPRGLLLRDDTFLLTARTVYTARRG
ncbi:MULTISPECIES: methyltransferase [unclassified Streptomyces]|uniref:class I SAM-dependent methyltransferase n=1 Tax=unclassified Streptomyces TaxID=2593676 RepID=UPI002E154A6B|nr:class I SAM-dependent methyltransferase [Streptomyces sp. NBC_01197]WSS52616.1 class I SAM-dependent methyltransferase [Streptomyces sp. NBC_01180]